MIQIYGGGISGLLCAYYAVQKGHKVTVYEKREKLGGKLATSQNPLGLMETAANAFLADQELENVCAEIGVRLLSKKKVARRRYIYSQGEISRWPLSLMDHWALLRFLGLKAMGAKTLLPQAHETLEQWAQRTLNPALTKNLIDPGCLGIFGVPSQKLSASLIYNYIFLRTKKYGKLRGSVAPEKGMGEFIALMQKYLQTKGVVFHTKITDQNLSLDDTVIVATDLDGAVDLLKRVGDSRAANLEKLPRVDLLSVNVFYKQRPEKQKAGFGVLFAREQEIIPLGVLFNSDIFPGRAESCHSETWIFGGLHPEGLLAQSETEILQILAHTRKKLWQDSQEPMGVRLNSWPRAIPLYGLELEQVLQSLEISRGSVHLMGNYLGEIGLNRLFHRAKNLIENLPQA